MTKLWSASEAGGSPEIDPRLPIGGQVYLRLKRAILSLQLPPSEALSEKELSLKLGVSRTPVREALIKLAEEGLVDVLPQRGSFVAPIRVAEVMEAQFIREALEVAVVRRLAATGTPAIDARLDANIRAADAALATGDRDGFMRLDEAFHHGLSDAAALPRAWKVIQNVKGQLDRVRFLSLPEPGHIAVLQAQHAAIVMAIRERDVDGAAEHMRTHLQEVFRSIDRLLNERPELFV